MNDNELIEYVPCPMHDILMFQWFGAICHTGEVRKLFLPYLWTISKFLEHLVKLPCVFKTDDNGIWFWASYAPMLSGAQFDMWIRKDKRHTKACVEAMGEALERGFQHWPVLIGLTTQENLLDAHKRMGYSVVGKVPSLWEGQDVWVMHVTKESFDARETFIIRR